MSKERKCACRTADPVDCLRLRYGISREYEEDLDDGGCECACHDFDQDGVNEWGVRAPGEDGPE